MIVQEPVQVNKKIYFLLICYIYHLGQYFENAKKILQKNFSSLEKSYKMYFG